MLSFAFAASIASLDLPDYASAARETIRATGGVLNFTQLSSTD